MIETIKILFLSVIHGVTSLLPVSSLAHFSLLKEVLGFTDENFNAQFYYAVFSLGTVAALIAFNFQMYSNVLKYAFVSKKDFLSEKEKAYKNAATNMGLSLLPLLLLLIPIGNGKFFESLSNYFLSDGSLIFVGIASIFCAILMFISFWYLNQSYKKKQPLLSAKDAFVFGVYQIPAYIFPGFSHVAIGASRTAVSDIGIKNVLKESYLYIAPAYLLVNLFRAIYYGITVGMINIIGAVIGFVISFILSMLIINVINYFTKKTYTVFTVYTLIFGVIVTVTSAITMFI